MNRYLIPLMCLVSFLSEGLQAQYYAEPDSVSVKKNSLGLIITPAVSFAMDAYAPNPRYGVQYKRRLSPNKQLRLTYIHDKIKYGEPLDEDYMQDVLLITNNTFRVYSNTRKELRNSLRIGMEWTETVQSHDAFFGFDIIAGYQKDRYELTHLVYNYYTPSYPAGSSQVIRQDNNRTEIAYGYKYDFIQLGIAPVIGWRFNIRQHFAFAVNASPELTFSLPVKSEWYGRLAPHYAQHPNMKIEFRMRVLEMVLSYRF
jgi:hypothetical protein